ncbi:GvpL/GvpF family gas vesicle protein [Nocardioides antri]|uniref:GvpL/GvpF family gas vesicle protein n=1 Tax=Nocardioides antri TaxID=2607659 RepID=A0A5B1M8A3_9ACTN|nr:GvpL/GvpF family gas vesicle protein [Nocardioides antri]KAA1427920.1 GvpL/GvpF family gas vesicle protein [Nocardioides antri]
MTWGGNTMPSARYLYAVCRGLDEAALDGVTGLDGRPVEVVGVLDLQAAVSTVDLPGLGEEGLRADLERPEWVERTARGHDTVVQACARSAPTAPMRLGTVCPDDGSVRRSLEEWYDDLAAALGRITGREQWSVKVYAHPRPSPAAGTEDARDQSSLAAEDLDAGLREVAVAARRVSGRSGGAMLLNGAYLVDAARARAFAERVAALGVAHPDVSVACDGPWPAYSFATLE